MLLGTPRGAFIAILKVNIHSPLRVFQGILSEYLTLKCSPIVVYMDFGYFLVTGYVCTHTGGWTPAYPMGFLGGLLGLFFLT
jgi:hypothetical protein